jgi:hypothetical protein
MPSKKKPPQSGKTLPKPKVAMADGAGSNPRGPDTPPLISIQISSTSTVVFEFFFFQTPGHLTVTLDQGDNAGALIGSTTLFDGDVPPPPFVHEGLPQLSSGRHVLSWVFQATSTPWQAVAEVSVDGVLQLRETTSDPAPLVDSFLILEVQ